MSCSQNKKQGKYTGRKLEAKNATPMILIVTIISFFFFFSHSCEQLPPTHLIGDLLFICLRADSTNALIQQMYFWVDSYS